MEDKTQDKETKKRYWIIRLLLWIFFVVSALLIFLIIAINIPAVQTFIAGKFIKSLREKTGTEVSLGSVKIALPNTVKINELFLPDKKADTMLYLHSLSVDVSLFGLLRNQVSVKSLALENVVANIHRDEATGKFNFQFLVDLFAADTTLKSDTATKTQKPWLIRVNDVNLQHLRVTFLDKRSGTDLRVNLGEFIATLKDIDIYKKRCNINDILLKNTSVQLALSESEKEKPGIQDAAETNKDSINKPPGDIFIDWNIFAGALTIENASFSLDNNSIPELAEGIDYAHLHLSEMNAVIRNISIDSEGYGAEFKKMNVSESCGLNLKMLAADAQFTNTKAELKNLKIETSASKISGTVSLAYASLHSFLAELWNSEVQFSLDKSSINANEIFLFVPYLAKQTYTAKFKNSDILISAEAGGKINDLNIDKLELSVLKNTTLKTNGRVTGLPYMAKLNLDIAIDQLSSNLTDINRFIDPAVYAGLKLPPSFKIKGNAKGMINSVKGTFEFKSSYGNIAADAYYRNYGKARRDSFSIDFSAQNLLAGTILADTTFDKTSFTGTAAGSGINSKEISGSAHLEIQSAKYNSYTYKNITLDGRMNAYLISATASSNDTNLAFRLFADADLRDTKKTSSAQLDVVKANLKALHFSETELSVSTQLTADANYGGLQDADAHLVMLNTEIIRPDRIVPVKSLEIQAVSTHDSLRIEIKSDVLDGTALGNIPAGNLFKTLQSAYKKYFGLVDTAQVIPGQNLDFTMNIHIPEDVVKLFSSESDALNISHLKGEYSSDNNELSVEMKLPEAMYSGIKLDSLTLAIKGENETLNMDISLLKIAYDTLNIENIRISEKVNKGIIFSEISTLDSIGKPSYLFANKIESDTSFLRFSFLPEGLILDNIPWKVKDGNWLEIRNKNLHSEQFVFSNGDQSIELIADAKNKKLLFGNFALQNLINIINFQEKGRLVKGNLDGEVNFPVPGHEEFINANISLNELYFMDTLVGNLFFNIKTENDRMDLESRFENYQNKITVTGDVDHLTGTPLLNLKALVDIHNLSRFERFSLGYLSEMQGKIDGEIAVKGTTLKPEITGFVGFEEAAFKVSSLNFLAKIKQEKVQFNSQGLHFTDFVIEDADAKKLTVEGDILTKNYTDFGFDLHIKTEDFQPINSTVADNQIFYGKLSIKTDVKLKGDVKKPEIVADVKINSSTNLTYALPGSELQLVTSDGIVQFLDFSQMNDSLSKVSEGDYLTDSIMSQLTGVDISLNLEIDPEAKFTIDIDPKSGDYLTISGGAKLNITADANGKQSITGIYEVKSGTYQLSFYGLVKKSFTIAPGSTVSWSGRPKDADLDITAEYEVRTSSVSLVANETAEMSDAEKQTFNKRLPYMVKLNIRGFLSEPEISFNIDLPEKYKITNPLVATKLALLNSEENKADLNKQVFALLVTGSFMADNPLTSNSSSPTNIASTAARNSVNGILADQLNNVSSKYITGVDVNFGLTSYEDFEEGSSGDIRTEMDIQVSKKLFNDRITVEAMGSFDLEGEKSNTTTSTSKKMTNEFAVIYQLTESGEYKLRAYYEDAYDLFDGDISYSGIALIFEKEFDTLKRKKKGNREVGNGK